MRLFRLALSALLVLAAVAPVPGARFATTAHAVASAGWTTYHYDNARSGNDPVEPAMTSRTAADLVSGALDEKIHAEPLVYSGLVYVATENDSIYALKETDLSVRWRVHPGTAVAYTIFPAPFGCEGSHLGNSSVGITSTPVIDTATGVLYAVGLVADGVNPAGHYQLFSVRIADGSAYRSPIDLAYSDIDPRAAGQRSALLLANGYVYVAFGGRAGDCPPYHPVVVAVSTTSSAALHWNPQTGGQSEAGIWAPSGFSADASGNVYVATGNGAETDCAAPWDYGNGVIKFSPPLTLAASWKPTSDSGQNWCNLSASDSDIGSLGPSLLSSGLIFQGGKSGNGYVLNASNMTQSGGTGARIPNCQSSNAMFGGNAYDGSHLFAPCNNSGIAALTIAPGATPAYSEAWFAAGFSPGPPIVAGGFLWATDQGGGVLHQINLVSHADTTYSIGAATRFNTPSADSGRIIVAESTSIRELNFGNLAPPSPPALPSSRTISYHLDLADDGQSWIEIDPELRNTVTLGASESALVTANMDLWTTIAGYNQDLGIFLGVPVGVSCPMANLLAWKESGGFAGTYSPNAAFVQAVYSTPGTHTFSLCWKPNRPAPAGTIYGAAGTASTYFSPTSLNSKVEPTANLATVSRANSYNLAESQPAVGSTWYEIDSALRLTLTPAASGTLLVGGNIDLWTSLGGYNQDVGIFSGACTISHLLAWKESGGNAGTYSPNAAFLQAAVPVTGGQPYNFNLCWKVNQPAPSGAIFAGAGTAGTYFSPTRLTAEFVPAGSAASAATTKSYHLDQGNDGASWVEVDPGLRIAMPLGSGQRILLGGNIDLWTAGSGYNQDIGIFAGTDCQLGNLLAWKESGGFGGTYSPNAAFVQAVYTSGAAGTYRFTLCWKANQPAPGGTIYGAAGTAWTYFSTTSLTGEPTS